MNKPYNRYIKDKIDAFMNLIFKYGYNDYELKPVLDAIFETSRKDMIDGTITTHDYFVIIDTIESLYMYAKRVCDNLRKEG